MLDTNSIIRVFIFSMIVISLMLSIFYVSERNYCCLHVSDSNYPTSKCTNCVLVYRIKVVIIKYEEITQLYLPRHLKRFARGVGSLWTWGRCYISWKLKRQDHLKKILSVTVSHFIVPHQRLYVLVLLNRSYEDRHIMRCSVRIRGIMNIKFDYCKELR